MLDYSGIYSITAPSGKRYFGSALKLRRRWASHRHALRNGQHINRHLQNAWNKHGEAPMRFAVVLVCRPQDLLFYEQLVLDGLRPEYNLSPTAGSSLGIKRPERLGVKHSPERCAAISAALKGRVFTDEWRAKLSAAQKARKRKPRTEASKQKVREITAAYWADRRARGLPLTKYRS